MRILVTGAGGGVGTAILELLCGTDVELRATCRRPDTVTRADVDTVAGDLTRPASLRPALREVDSVFLYAFPDVDHLPELVAEMASAGVSRVVVLSTIDTTRDEPFVAYNKSRHLAVENAVADAGFATVCLRPGAFARNAVRFWAEQIRTRRAVRLPFPDSQQAPIADEDIAAVAVRALSGGDLDGQRIVLTGPQSLTMRQQVQTISDALGEPIAIEQISQPAARDLYGRVLPPAYLDLLMGQWAFETTEAAVVTDAVATITGRPAIDYGTWAASHRDDFE